MDKREYNHGGARSYVTPLVISLAGIIFSTLALAAYHYIVMRCCLVRPQHLQQQLRNNNNNEDDNNDNDRNGNKKSCGVQEEILNKIPIISYSTNTSDVFGFDQIECSICLGELEDGDLVRVLPACNHAFHIPCIDAWFIAHASCPFCRSPITCDCESVVPIASENDGQQRVSHENPSDQNQLMDDDVSGSTTTSRFQQPLQPVLLRHSLYAEKTTSFVHVVEEVLVYGSVIFIYCHYHTKRSGNGFHFCFYQMGCDESVNITINQDHRSIWIIYLQC